MKRRITRITVQTEREVIFSPEKETREAWCERCAREVQLIDHSEAAGLLGIDSPRPLTERDAIHLVETTKGCFLICLDSLRRHTNSDD